MSRSRAGGHTPLRRRIPADLETPVSAFLKLRPRGASFLLESVEQGIQVGRYSFIGISPQASFRLVEDCIEVQRGGATHRLPVDRADPFAPVRAELESCGPVLGEHLPGPFAGAVGYISYDMVRFFERLPAPRPEGLGLPDYHLLFPQTLAVFDHVKSEIELITLPPPGDPARAYAEAQARIEVLLDALAAPLAQPVAGRDRLPATAEPCFHTTQAEFERQVLQAKEHIFAGDIFQAVLSQRLHGATRTQPFQIYRALRILNPSPYMFFMDFDQFQIIGSSPEVLVKLERGIATLAPIAGTRPRGETSRRDAELERELLGDEKERAEHLMLVDLGRNDLGRVCELGSVAADSLMQIEKYSHVMHIVSRLRGRLRRECDMFDLLRAAFPAGTVSGAPKIRAMEIIRELEQEQRGPYAGAVGYFGRQGDMDMCIAIRTLIVKDGAYFAQAGAGIVADSDPGAEYRETLDKLRALTRAIAIAEEGL